MISPLNNPEPLRPSERTASFEKIVGKGENDGNQHFLLFSQCFPLKMQSFETHFKYRPRMLSLWARVQFCRLVKCKTHVLLTSAHCTVLPVDESDGRILLKTLSQRQNCL